MNTVKCSRLCGTELYFSDNHVSKSGKKIPLEVQYAVDDPKHEKPLFTNKDHQCPNSTYNKDSKTTAPSSIATFPDVSVVKEFDFADATVKAHYSKFDSDMLDFEMMESFITKRYGQINPAKAGMIIKFLEERRRERKQE